MSTGKRIYWVEYLRILSCIAVIMLHVAADCGWWTMGTGWEIANFFHGITRFAVPTFVMISGMFYLDSDYDFSIGKFVGRKGKVWYILIVYMVWTILYSFYTLWLNYIKTGSTGDTDLFTTIINLNNHLWYLKMLIVLLIMTPLFRAITARKDLCEYYLLLTFIFVYLKNWVGEFDFPSKWWIMSIWSRLDTGLLVHSGYYVLGLYINKYYKGSKVKNSALYLLGVMGILFSIYCAQKNSLSTGTPVQSWYLEQNAPTVLFTAGIFLFFKENISHINLPKALNYGLLKIAKYTMGIYLLHLAVLYFIEYLGLNFQNFGGSALTTFALIIALTAVTFTISLLLAFSLKKIPILHKIL